MTPMHTNNKTDEDNENGKRLASGREDWPARLTGTDNSALRQDGDTQAVAAHITQKRNGTRNRGRSDTRLTESIAS
ncbi:hypothetical protein E2562_006943 [Oryza meyeriana var. granulata]|uniref:Uncharacterized protein n=1 Tax=Oryza meyeriana var. granulata TaxID=110450 RepID=A0A6G1E9M6_9ORYZ|nr:hypothetical protein E2562_006943 [Oryza meyeriana var. granulata]